MNLAVFDYEVYDKKYNIMEYYFKCPFGGQALRCSLGTHESWLLMSDENKDFLVLNSTISCIWRHSNNVPVSDKKQMVEELVSEDQRSFRHLG